MIELFHWEVVQLKLERLLLLEQLLIMMELLELLHKNLKNM